MSHPFPLRLLRRLPPHLFLYLYVPSLSTFPWSNLACLSPGSESAMCQRRAIYLVNMRTCSGNRSAPPLAVDDDMTTVEGIECLRPQSESLSREPSPVVRHKSVNILRTWRTIPWGGFVRGWLVEHIVAIHYDIAY